MEKGINRVPEACAEAFDAREIDDEFIADDHDAFIDRTPKQGNGAFCRFPNQVVRDNRLSARSLGLLAYRATIADDRETYGLNEKVLLRDGIFRPKTGFGVNAIRDAISECKRLGYLQRQQNGRSANGQFPYATDRLALPPCGESGKAARIVRREWFNGSLSVKEMALFLYLRAGTGRGPYTYAKEIAERFGWSPPLVAKVLRALIDLGLVEKRVARDRQGQFGGTAFEAVSTVLWGKAATVKKPCNGSPCNGKAYNTRSNPLHGLPSEEPFSRTLRGSYASAPRDASTPNYFHDDQGSVSVSPTNFLAWAEGEPYEDELLSTNDEVVDAICDLASDDELRSLLRKAAGGRIRNDILSQGGLDTVRIIAAYILEHPPIDKTITPAEALNYVLGAIRDRIGDRPNAWLNSLGVIGKRLLAPTIGGDGVDETPFRSKRRKGKKSAPKPTKELQVLIKADGARVLSRKLCRDPDGLNKLLRKYGPEALDTIKSCLTGAMIYDSSVAQIKSWSYFIGPIEDERRAAQFMEHGIRPGDAPGWRNARANNSNARGSGA